MKAAEPRRGSIARDSRIGLSIVGLGLALALASCGTAPDTDESARTGIGTTVEDEPAASALSALLVAAADIDARSVLGWRAEGYGAVAIALTEDGSELERAAAATVLASGSKLYYWFEIARDERLAETHPEWMASVQGHDEWRRLHPEAPRPGEGEVIKAWPWTPILYAEVFAAKLSRVDESIRRLPAPSGVFLNDLQGAPSACGCGHPLCRWTTDYGPIVTATRLESDAAARFVRELRVRHPSIEVVPVWATECEEHDGAPDGACAGVGCYRGACWREYEKQLLPVVESGERLGVLLTYKALGRDLPVYGTTAGWVRSALETFGALPPEGTRSLLPAAGLVAVLQGWDVTPEEIRAQVRQARDAGVTSTLVARRAIDASWEPRLHRSGEP